jgi:hypothetical protein
MPWCRCGNEFSEARARLGFATCLDCGSREAAAETARRARMIVPSSHKSGYTYLGPDRAGQRRRLLEGSAKTPPMETDAGTLGQSARPREPVGRRWEFVGFAFEPDERGVRQKRALLRERRRG